MACKGGLESCGLLRTGQARVQSPCLSRMPSPSVLTSRGIRTDMIAVNSLGLLEGGSVFESLASPDRKCSCDVAVVSASFAAPAASTARESRACEIISPKTASASSDIAPLFLGVSEV
eukprot:scaffold102625_cov30-Tisochrysis_lutea.AAC.2